MSVSNYRYRYFDYPSVDDYFTGRRYTVTDARRVNQRSGWLLKHVQIRDWHAVSRPSLGYYPGNAHCLCLQCIPQAKL